MGTATQLTQNKRITLKRKRPNPLFQEWLEELHEEAESKGSKLEPMLKEALESISKYPLPLKTGAECAILRGFEKKLCLFLDKRLEVYNSNKSLENQKQHTKSNSNENLNLQCSVVLEKDSKLYCNAPQTLSKNKENSEDKNDEESIDKLPAPSRSNSSSQDPPSQKTSKERIYKPAFRSGGYAILLGLLENLQENPSEPALAKENLIEKAQKYSEESFVRPKPESFYTAWSNMSRLVSKGLVEKSKKKKVVYSLSEQGVQLAKILINESKDRPTDNDLIFNTGSIGETNDSQESGISRNTDSGMSSQVGSQTSTADQACIEMPAGSFEVILLIDKNETGGVTKKNDPTVAQFNKYPDLKHEYRSLKVGDFTWVARHKESKEELVLPYVIERKRMDDLGASIKDGRFHEQKFRLRKCGLKNVIYMVENYGGNKHVGLPIQSLMQAMANTRVQDGFKIHMTNSLSNSARFLAMMTKRLTIEYKDQCLFGYNREPINKDFMTFKYFNKSAAKTKPLTVTETFIKLLLQLKGVSVEKALAITNVYSTPANLIKAYENCNSKEGEMLLAYLKYGNTSRNVGPIVSKAIYQLFSKRVLS
ncbi:crossover junction endonuclease MUS81 [Ostrinia nubilalis]|uniref:crossover junction endonuclease MUS81 n=1 Tax=Ostrinia nubilalis TaxID=29057 RepID=UPI0030822C58